MINNSNKITYASTFFNGDSFTRRMVILFPPDMPKERCRSLRAKIMEIESPLYLLRQDDFLEFEYPIDVISWKDYETKYGIAQLLDINPLLSVPNYTEQRRKKLKTGR